MSGESLVQGLEDYSHMNERAETDWVWIYIADDWIDGPIPAYRKDPEG